MDLRNGVWREETVFFRRAQQVQARAEGDSVLETTPVGREFTVAGNLTSVFVGGSLRIDELPILDRVIEPEQVAEHYPGAGRIHDYRRPRAP